MALLPRRPDRVLLPRILFSFLFAGVMFGGPFYRQVLGGRSEWVKDWVMYAGVAVNFCKVDYRRSTPEGWEAFPRLPTLGYAHFWEAPREKRLLRSLEAVRDDVRRLCATDPTLELRATVDCATRQGWKRRIEPDRNLCAEER